MSRRAPARVGIAEAAKLVAGNTPRPPDHDKRKNAYTHKHSNSFKIKTFNILRSSPFDAARIFNIMFQIRKTNQRALADLFSEK
jgi:hypothetical protein